LSCSIFNLLKNIFYTDYFIISLVKIPAKVEAVLKIPYGDVPQRIRELTLSSPCPTLPHGRRGGFPPQEQRRGGLPSEPAGQWQGLSNPFRPQGSFHQPNNVYSANSESLAPGKIISLPRNSLISLYF
jgi:hypothetical protein